MGQIGIICQTDKTKGAQKDSCLYAPDLIDRLVLTKDFSLVLTEEQIKNENGDLNQLIQEKKVWFTSSFDNATDNSSGVRTSETGYGTSIRTAEGNLSVTFDVLDSVCNRNIMKEYWDNKRVGVFMVDANGVVTGKSVDGGLAPAEALIYVQRKHLKAAIGDIAYTYSLTITMDDIEHSLLDGVATVPEFLTLDGIADLKATFTDVDTDGTFNMKLVKGCSGIGVAGLTSANFIARDDAEVDLGALTIVDNGNGDYTVTLIGDESMATIETNGVINLNPGFVELEQVAIA